jgi:hypothetical protein
VAAFLTGATAADIVDKTLTITNDAPSSFAIGTTTVTFVVTDDSGNQAQASAKLTVVATPPSNIPAAPLPAPADRTPPDDVKDLKAKAGHGSVALSWTKPAAQDFDHVVVTRTLSDGSGPAGLYSGSGTTFVDGSVQDGVTYRYTVVSYDRAGNHSAGAVVTALPQAPLLLAPRDGARVRKPLRLLLAWAAQPGADYYNLQVFFGREKVLSVWPKPHRFLVQRTWKFAGKRHRLLPGVYRWYVWPGHGPRKNADYGPLMGSSSFEVVR